MKITAMTNGPLLVQGPLALLDQNGQAFTPKDGLKYALCRCGGSSNKPFCDGTHKVIGFKCPAIPGPPALQP